MLYYAERPYTECRILFTIMLNVIMLSVVMLSVIMRSVGEPFNSLVTVLND
jgi:hypothetical protein